MAQLGGLGAFSGDKGNGQWIAENVFRLVYDDIVLGLEPTMLTRLTTQAFALAGPEELPGVLAALEANPETAKRLIGLFFQAGNAGDPPVLRRGEEMALRGAQFIAAQLKKLDIPDPAEVVLSGSIHTKLPNDAYMMALREKTAALTGRELVFRKLEQPPVKGCIEWILQCYA
jgi:N-acetylglucosamine kinase-like BadF-type ATPase